MPTNASGVSARKAPTVAVVGGGFAGLGAATALADRGLRVCLVERSASLGGLASGFREPRWRSSLERHYHHLFRGDHRVGDFARRWGLADGPEFSRVETAVETAASGFRCLDSPLALLRFPELAAPDKLRLLAALAWLRYGPHPARYAAASARAWCRRHMGPAAFEAIWEPLITGKFGEDYAARVRMDWLAARIRSRTPVVGSFTGGLQRLADSAGDWLRSQGVQIDLGAEATEIRTASPGLWQATVNGEHVSCDAVLVAASPQSLVELVTGLPPSYSDELSGRPNLGIRTLILALDRPLSDRETYWYSLRPTQESPFLVAVAHTRWVPASEFGGEHIVYLSAYGDVAGPSRQWDEGDLLSAAAGCLSRIQPDFGLEWIRRHWVFQDEYAQPVPVMGLREPPPIAVPECPGLFHVSMAHITPWDRSINWALWLGAKAAKCVSDYLASG